MADLRVNAIRFVQNGRVFYSTAILAGDLLTLTAVDIWSPDTTGEATGYQRLPSRTRLRQVANYLHTTEAILPEGGFANVRPQNSEGRSAYGKQLGFEGDSSKSPSAGTLVIPSSTKLYLVDMQHRLYGLKLAIEEDGRADLKNFPIVITIADGLTKLEEVEQFEIINTSQKKVRTDLARRIMSIRMDSSDQKRALDLKGRLWEARGPIICQHLNTRDGVWKGCILPPNNSKTTYQTAIVRETSFVTSLKPILQTPMFSRLSDSEAANLIGEYWAALKDLWPAAFENPEEYVLQKTPGIFSLHGLAPHVFELIREKKQDINRVTISEELLPIGEQFDATFWRADSDEGASQRGSMKGFRILESELRALLPVAG